MVDEAFALKVSNNLDLAGTAPLLCAGITTYSPLRHSNVHKGQKVGVVGLGGLGHMGVKFANAFGAHVVLFTTSASKRGLPCVCTASCAGPVFPADYPEDGSRVTANLLGDAARRAGLGSLGAAWRPVAPKMPPS